MTKKEMISELVKEFRFDESTLEDKLKNQVEEIYNDFFPEDEDQKENELKYDEDYVETNNDRLLVDKSTNVAEEPKEEVSEEKEEIDISKLSKRERRSLARSSKI
jgi:hypothetical protein